jgi:mannose-1-phosphate guanylyltransferase
MKCYGVIMAGGGGTRFWPLSRQEKPKQMLNLSGNDLMINETIDRIAETIPNDDVFIVTNEKQADRMKVCVNGRVKTDHILSEPSARNTAACIGYAAFEIVKKYGDGIMCIFPSDHFIKNNIEFNRILKEAVNAAETQDKLVTIGINPTFPSTGYGYIKYDKFENAVAKKVMEFKEKPDHETAKAYLESGNYAWNSGMFIWKASTILKNFERYLPKVYECLIEISNDMCTDSEAKTIERVYPLIPSISIDYGIMERSSDVIVISGEFGWNDVGSWDMLDVLYDVDENGNVIHGEQINIDTTNCISYSSGKLISTIGVDNLVIVETGDAVLVCSKDRVQDVKKIVDELKERNMIQYL